MKEPVSIDQIGIPLHKCQAQVFLIKKALQKSKISLYDLSSHQRAKEAIEFGLKMREKQFHIFVIGEDRTGPLDTTMAYLNEYVKKLPTPNDWVYVNNFLENHRPLPFSLPPGKGRYLKDQTIDLLNSINIAIRKVFTSSNFRKQVDNLNQHLQSQIDQQTKELQKLAKSKGFELMSGVDGLLFGLSETANQDKKSTASNENESAKKDLQMLNGALNKLNISVTQANQKIDQQVKKLEQEFARNVIKPLFQDYKDKFSAYLKGWIDDFKRDILDNLCLFFDEENPKAKLSATTLERYTINVIIDHEQVPAAKVVLESNPTFENLFGSIKYRSNPSTGSLETNFTFIRPGAIHRANGGILVLRAHEIFNYEDVWNTLKASLRDGKISIRERYRENGTQLDDAPSPHSIPLDLQIFLIASPLWYYSFLQQDSEFAAYFKIRAEIEPDLLATPKNITIYQKLIRNACLQETGRDITPTAISYLTGYSARWAQDRKKLSAKFGYVSDILAEAAILAKEMSAKKPIDEAIINKVLRQRRRRNTCFEDSAIEDIIHNRVMIDTSGHKVGLVNGLTVLSLADRSFGLPTRISARTYVGEAGVVNIERLTELGGPIQQKGALILEGFLNSIFAQKSRLSCTCSLTFEQNYSDVEGDSASMAELIAILSSLANVPIRQDLAITGSINQLGYAQAVGGIHLKVEGFHRLCKERGFTKTQGVIIPNANITNLTLRSEIVEDIQQGNFQIWGISTICEAIELLTGRDAGLELNAYDQIIGPFKKDSIFDLADKTLKKFERSLKHRRTNLS